MRCKAASWLIALLACVAFVAGCGSSGPAPRPNTNAQVKVTGSFGKSATVSIPKATPSGKLAVSKPIKGSGAALTSGNAILTDIALYKWSGKTHTLVDSTYSSGPQIIPTDFLPGLTTALKGVTMGSRIVAVLPPKDGYGSQGNSELGITGSDTLVWVLDVLQQYSPTASASGAQVADGGGALPTVTAKTAGQAPTVTVPKKSPPTKLSVTTLIKGTGPKVANGDTVVAQYVAYIWRTGKVFSTTWPSSAEPESAPFSFQLGTKLGVAGFGDGLQGVPVGSRVMLVIPPSLGYGKAGNSSAGIKGNDTLIFVVDVLGVQPPIT
jgi:FKBP-type peptidyl-prolyl cis-trans isomerase